jgi:GNAT superfamily N-acetyltransferase
MRNIRLATVGDSRAIAEIHVLGWRAAYRGIVPDIVLEGLSIDARAAQWRGRLDDAVANERRVWVIEVDRHVQGFAVTARTRDEDEDAALTSELMALYLHPDAWGIGLGRDLVVHALADVRTRGWREASLWVLESNARARRFYEKAGFAVDGARKSVAQGDKLLIEVRYRLVLAAPGSAA